MQQAAVPDTPGFVLERRLNAPPELVWCHWVEASRRARWWAPPAMTVTQCVLDPAPGGRVVLEYRDAARRYRAEGRVTVADAPTHLAFELAVLDAAGLIWFAARYDLVLAADGDGTLLRLSVSMTGATGDAAASLAGIGSPLSLI